MTGRPGSMPMCSATEKPLLVTTQVQLVDPGDKSVLYSFMLFYVSHKVKQRIVFYTNL